MQAAQSQHVNNSTFFTLYKNFTLSAFHIFHNTFLCKYTIYLLIFKKLQIFTNIFSFYIQMLLFLLIFLPYASIYKTFSSVHISLYIS